MERVTIPYSGTLLVAQLAAYGFALALDDAGIDAFVGHDTTSQSFEPIVVFDADRDAAHAAVRASAIELEDLVEHDVEPGKTGNDRRATIWARRSMERGGERLRTIVELRAGLVEQADRAPGAVPAALLGGLGAPAAWGPERMKTPAGATALDGVLGNNTSDFVRGVLRPTRKAAAALDPDPFALGDLGDVPSDKTGWAPPGTKVDYVHQWLAALGLALLPVAHRPLERSATPACWRRRGEGAQSGVTLPVLEAPVSVPRMRALLALDALAQIRSENVADGDAAIAASELRGLGVGEAVVFERRSRAGAGSSVAFDFRRGRLVTLR